MSTIKNIKTLSLASGTALVLGMASGSVLAADSNPFGMTSLSGGYQVAVNEDKNGEGKCGESKEAEGKCGGDKADDKPKVQEAKCGEGKCGESS